MITNIPGRLLVPRSFAQTLCLLVLMVGFTACKKEINDNRPDNRVTTVNRAPSATRIVNMGGYVDVVANGEKLTSYVYRSPNDPDAFKYTGTAYFPEDGRLGSSWQIPQDLFRKDGTLLLKLDADRANGSLPELTIKDDYQHPKDYYLLLSQHLAEGQPDYVEIERGVTQPSRPDHFKIRILNLCAKPKEDIISPRGQIEDLTGPVSLAYADGLPVSDKTTNISVAQRVSEYIELPYGAYQFKVLTADGRQIPGAAALSPDNRLIDPPTSSIGLASNGEVVLSDLTFAPVISYQAGGIYTIVVAPYSFDYLVSAQEQRGGAIQNGFRVITDVSAPPNTTYFRLQGCNVLPGSGGVSFRVNGNVLVRQLAYGQPSSYGNYVQGNTRVEALNAAGAVLAAAEYTLRPGQNYTAWLYPDVQGGAKLVLVVNELSGQLYSAGTVNNGSNGGLVFKQVREDFMFDRRFLNLSQDIPYLTFTFGNGLSAGTAAVNLQPGIPVTTSPYIHNNTLLYHPYEIMAYRSAPDVVPGAWAKDITVLNSDRFVARRELYEAVHRAVPTQEPGIFTIALIGRTGKDVPAAEKAKMIIVKHNR
ncbi:DUF4397 domain-containing protein [Chitinophaga nivalis]|uniref:DUF4397 domain-containing protein n=1 Tax=Chitinophaga nivalis TaxID=2991709 RepID=A0ABT3IIY6_9BACT|nr:DUF4397 domain-containing protein [Chitinophaga nivalis]MCW3466383.1 DUF4397 domain-containing protein [Chitinophaga nivalis]MCW3483926.1 DUF4397 domain-containing protein [Chitinophaga nivalis]